MTRRTTLALFAALCLPISTVAEEKPRDRLLPKGTSTNQVPDNPRIDMETHLKIAAEAAEHRKTHRLSEDDFLRISQEPGVVVLDCRSKEKFDELHIEGAVNMSFPDLTEEGLRERFPDKNVKLLIYCNNNFKNALAAMPTKRVEVALNISTFITLYTYGYKNVWELGPYLDAKTTKLKLVSTPKPQQAQTASK
jgi:phage shock protein E